MTPAVPAVLAELAAVLMRNAAPDVPDAERAAGLGISAMILMMAAETWDGAAAALVADNRALREVLEVHGDDDDLRLSALKADNDRLRSDLIAAQARAETQGDTALQDRIWRMLAASTERRKLSSSPL
jgi:hypothetical protein